MIPKIIHQTWRTRWVPERFAAYVASWQSRHPDWEWWLWSDADNRRLIRRHARAFLGCYDSYPHPIQRADAVRYFILDRYGGLYVDLDFECLRPIDPLVAGRDCVLSEESREHSHRFGRERIVSNAWMAAEPGHPFFRQVIERLPEFAARPDPVQPVLTTTGPFMLSDVYAGFDRQDIVTLLPAERLFPLSMTEATARLEGERRDVHDAYAIHYHVGSWWRPDTDAARLSRHPAAGGP